jgi:hypothetical protein
MSRGQIYEYSGVRTRKKMQNVWDLTNMAAAWIQNLHSSDPNLSGNNLNLDFLKDLLQQMKLQFMTLVQNQIAKDEIVR